MNEHGDKRWYQALPPKMAALVVFLVALTTLLGNLFELNEKRQTAAPTTTPAAAQPAPASASAAQPAQAAAPVATTQRVNLRLERIAVEHDGSPGTTDWRFTVAADGKPLLAFAQDGLDDTGGRNISLPEQVQAAVRLQTGQRVRLQVQGWRQSRLRTASAKPDAVGEGELTAAGELAPMRVAAAEPAGGAFTFYFFAEETAASGANAAH